MALTESHFGAACMAGLAVRDGTEIRSDSDHLERDIDIPPIRLGEYGHVWCAGRPTLKCAW
jgi:hypothetical protein